MLLTPVPAHVKILSRSRKGSGKIVVPGKLCIDSPNHRRDVNGVRVFLEQLLKELTAQDCTSGLSVGNGEVRKASSVKDRSFGIASDWILQELNDLTVVRLAR